MSNVLIELKKHQVIALGRLGWSLRRIERETGVRRETAAGYLKADGIAVRSPGAWGRRPPPPPDSKPANEVIPDSGPDSASLPLRDPPQSSTTASISEPFREVIEEALTKGRNAKAIWQDLVDDHSFSGGYQSVKRFINKLRGSPSQQQPCAIIVTAPGEEAQVDYGEGPLVKDTRTGRYRRTRLFVLTLGFSRKCIRLLVFTSNTPRLGGTARDRVPQARRRAARIGPRQSSRSRPEAGHLRSRAQSG